MVLLWGGQVTKQLERGGVGASEAAFVWWFGSFRGGFHLVVWEL